MTTAACHCACHCHADLAEQAACQEGKEGLRKALACPCSALHFKTKFLHVKIFYEVGKLKFSKISHIVPFYKTFSQSLPIKQTFQNGFSKNHQCNSRLELPVTTMALCKRGMPPFNVIAEVRHVKH